MFKIAHGCTIIAWQDFILAFLSGFVPQQNFKASHFSPAWVISHKTPTLHSNISHKHHLTTFYKKKYFRTSQHPAIIFNTHTHTATESWESSRPPEQRVRKSNHRTGFHFRSDLFDLTEWDHFESWFCTENSTQVCAPVVAAAAAAAATRDDTRFEHSKC